MSGALAAEVDTGRITLRPAGEPDPGTPRLEFEPGPASDAARRAFDYDVFEQRLLGLWFQRKVFLAQGRAEDAARQSESIRAFCESEGVGRLPGLADALLVEADQSLEQGHHRRAREALDLAEDVDPGRPQVRFARAAVYWRSGEGMFRSIAEFLAGTRAALAYGLGDLSLVNPFGIVLVVAAMAVLVLFAILMLLRYHVPFRHEIEEWSASLGHGRWGSALGWLALLAPLIVWVGAGWAALFWIAVLFRFMRRPERLAAIMLVLASMLAVPVYRVSVAAFGLTTDPIVRTTLEAAHGSYSPERIVRLRDIVETHPEDATLRFLLAGMYENGRYYAEAFAEYRRALDLEPGLYQAEINIGNLYHRTGQYSEAIANYLRALDTHPDSALAYYNMHLAQSESFRFKEAAESLERARTADPELLSGLMSRGGDENGRPGVVDARVDLGTIWSAALEGDRVLQHWGADLSDRAILSSIPRQFVNPITIAALATLVFAVGFASIGRPRPPARRCIRCGRPFCHRCKSGREGHEYCSQCLHLFVLGDGLAPETKSRKLYEVARHARWTDRLRRIAGTVVPGSSQILRGRVLSGVVFAVLWFAALVAWKPVVLHPVERVLGLDLRLDLLRAGDVPAAFAVDPWSFLGILIATIVWVTANATLVRRRREA